MNYKILKNLSSWPLSQVDLISVDGQSFILKTIHSDFAIEVNRQKYLADTVKIVHIPEIHDHWTERNKMFFVMDYIEADAKVSESESLRIINTFHNETIINSPNLFSIYSISEFSSDYKEIKSYLKPKLNSCLSNLNFEPVFKQNLSVVHGDWETNQIIIHKEKPYIVDFGRSFYGPSILDFAYFCRDRRILDQQVFDLLNINSNLLDLAKIVSNLMQLKWFHSCKKYINYNYTEEIDKINDRIKDLTINIT